MASNNHRKPELARPCRTCGETFWPFHDRSHYCSRTCMARGFSNRVERTCTECSATFMAIPSAVEKGEAKFCSHACHNVSMMLNPATIPDRFWSRVNKDGPIILPTLGPCWCWIGAVDKDGYGMFHPQGGTTEQRSHRWSWILSIGSIPDGMQVLHHCDNPPCVRPEHLFLGTTPTNVADKVAKNRHARGERLGQAKLTKAAVLDIRTRWATGSVTQTALAREYGVWPGTISSIIRRRLWKHIP